ncbi:hypothetical protein ABN12_004230 [Salmonella enterica subsp. enterica serovar Mississippi]|nr:hypothetical protein [Salmonella enterica]EBW9546913.1 hypothetical protein [Salmonella enterica subsp. enterica serovar Mississippi]EBY6475773.1 hypothetical protein [Salmonella enterica subsp. enterica serovar Hessarek]ECL8868906.1 hypothetical protein [Salmonella enterica subsp. enterica serovar Ibadan]EDV5650277.1 hypothetical protein [Salmonella enterica subsp. enterica]
MATVSQTVLEHLKIHGIASVNEIHTANPQFKKSQYATAIANLIFRGELEVAENSRGAGMPRKVCLGNQAPRDLSIVEQCKLNWKGYNIHKVFGQSGRGSA